MNRATSLCIAALLFLLTSVTEGQILATYEAEDWRAAKGHASHDCVWASGGGVMGNFWGEKAGDTIEVELHLSAPLEKSRLAIRYSYACDHYLGFRGLKDDGKDLQLLVDELPPVTFQMKDTGWWDLFETVYLDIPDLPAGRHFVRLRAVNANTTRNIDCFTFFRGDPDTVLSPAFRKTVLARSASGRFEVRATPTVKLQVTPDQIIREFEGIYDVYAKFMGWEPPLPVGINLIADERWDNPGATSYQNRYGVFFRAGVMHTEQGNWLHEMTHMFYVGHFPGWFDEASVRALTTCAWAPRLYPTVFRGDAAVQARFKEGRDVLQNPGSKFNDPDPLISALCVKYGPDVFSRFFQACGAAGRTGDLDFTPGRHLTKDEIARYMSVAAKDNVRPLFEQWNGFPQQP